METQTKQNRPSLSRQELDFANYLANLYIEPSGYGDLRLIGDTMSDCLIAADMGREEIWRYSYGLLVKMIKVSANLSNLSGHNPNDFTCLGLIVDHALEIARTETNLKNLRIGRKCLSK